MKPKCVIVHTAAHGPQGADTTKADLWKWHVEENGWSDIGYHYLIRKSGFTVPCRPLSEKGAHCREENNSIGICLSGHGDYFPMTNAQRYALKQVLLNIFVGYPHLTEKDVYPHNHFNPNKTCPGKWISSQLPEVVENAWKQYVECKEWMDV